MSENINRIEIDEQYLLNLKNTWHWYDWFNTLPTKAMEREKVANDSKDNYRFLIWLLFGSKCRKEWRQKL